jgi:1-acyl-sn-glycerol-3-phosphate acyltransferase
MLERFFRWLINMIIDLVCDLNVTGLENIPETGGYIIASNHLGRLDALLVYKVIQRKDIIMVVAEKYQKYWFYRLAAKALDAIFVDRHMVDLRSMRKVVKRLQAGEVLAIAPEGTRSKAESLLEGKPGTAYLAEKTQLPVVPVALTGSEDRIVKANLKKLRRSRVIVTIGTLFYLQPSPKQKRSENLQNATDEIMVRIALLLPEKYRGVYKAHPKLYEL